MIKTSNLQAIKITFLAILLLTLNNRVWALDTAHISAITAGGSELNSTELYASYLFPDNGYIYLSFDASVTNEIKEWWLEVIAFADAVIEPEFVIVPQGSAYSQMEIIHLSSENTSSGTPGLYTSPLTTYWSDGRIERNTVATLEIANSAYSHSTRFAKSMEAGWKHVAFHEFGHALGLEHPHDAEDGDSNDSLTTNDTVMSYKTELDMDGSPAFTPLDILALTRIHGSESTSLSNPAAGELATSIGAFDINKSWKPPSLYMVLNREKT